MDAKTRLCCLIGNPVGHSLSPMIHNTLAEELGINLCYTAFKVEKTDCMRLWQERTHLIYLE